MRDQASAFDDPHAGAEGHAKVMPRVHVEGSDVAASYRKPELIALGTAVELVRSNSNGNARDSRNYWVYP